MFRRLLCLLAVLGGLAALAVPAMAGEEFGSIRVTLQNGESVVPDGSVWLYRVGASQGTDYWLTEAFGGGIVKEADALSPILARWLAEMAGEDGLELELDGAGSAEFDELPEGLYLLMQMEASTGYHPMEPMTVMIPCQDQWHVQAYPKTDEIIYAIAPEIPSTGQSPAPFIGAAGMILSGAGLAVCIVRKRRN